MIDDSVDLCKQTSILKLPVLEIKQLPIIYFTDFTPFNSSRSYKGFLPFPKILFHVYCFIFHTLRAPLTWPFSKTRSISDQRFKSITYIESFWDEK
jgi:hypothetical protein